MLLRAVLDKVDMPCLTVPFCAVAFPDCTWQEYLLQMPVDCRLACDSGKVWEETGDEWKIMETNAGDHHVE